MVQDVYEASWEILQALRRIGKSHANNILSKTNIGGRTTLFNALKMLLKDGYIQRDSNKMYSINISKMHQDESMRQALEFYDIESNRVKELFDDLEESFKNHKQILNSEIPNDINIARELIMKNPYSEIIGLMIQLAQLSSLMNFVVNASIVTKVMEKRAMSLKNKNEKITKKYLELLKRVEPVLWAETVILVQQRLSTNISPDLKI